MTRLIFNIIRYIKRKDVRMEISDSDFCNIIGHEWVTNGLLMYFHQSHNFMQRYKCKRCNVKKNIWVESCKIYTIDNIEEELKYIIPN